LRTQQNKITPAEVNNSSVQTPFFQPKPIINQPNDIYEQEADAMAEKVLQEAQSEKKFFSPPIIQRKCSHCDDEEVERKLQRKEINTNDIIIQRQDDNEPQQNNGFQLPPFRPQLLPPLIPPLKLGPPFDSIDYLGLREPFFNRGVMFPGSYMDAAQQEWGRQYLFYKQFGLGSAIGNTFIGSSLHFFGVKPPGGDWNAWLSNTTTPLAIDSALSHDFPNLNEQEERRGGLPAPTIFHLPEVHFKKAAEPENAVNGISSETEDYINTLSGGEPLSETEREIFEPGINSDFSDVRIHSDSAANESAENLNALAYTQGNNIVFGSGQYQPETDEGKRLLAHELTHVVQQNGMIQRKPAVVATSIEENLRELLEAGKYTPAYLQLNDFLDWGNTAGKKTWLADHPKIRYLFLNNLPSSVTAEVYSADELIFKPAPEAFAMIDCWYQTEPEKQLLYSQNPPLFDLFVQSISPYSGESIVSIIAKLTSLVPSKSYKNYAANSEFHTINLLAPTTERKIKFYAKYSGLFNAVSKKFDPFTGVSKEIFDYLTDTDKIDKERAIGIYDTLKGLPEEQRNAFLDTAAFAGSLEADKDAEKYYSKNYKAQYKALPHNWDTAIMPWNWGKWDAPFAERLTVDHVALMSSKLTYEYKDTRKFGFDTGIDSSKDVAAGKDKSDKDKFMGQLQDDAIFSDGSRLYLLLAICIRAGLEKEITEKVLRTKSEEGKISPQLLAVIESYGFTASDKFNYHADKARKVDHDIGQIGYIINQTLFGGKSGKVIGEQRGTFDLLKLQESKDNLGSLGGMRFDNALLGKNEYYDETWLDKQVKGHEGSDTLRANLEATKGSARQNKIFASIRNDIKQANIYASTLLVQGLNYFKAGTLYRSGPGLLQGISIHLSWTKDTSDPDNDIYLSLGIDNILLNNFQLVAPKSTIAIGQIAMKGMNISFSQKKLPAAEGIFMGLFKNADYTLNALMALLPNVLMLLPNAVMTLTEEFKGAKAQERKNKLGALLQSDFSSVQFSLSFTSVKIKNLYDTTAGFLDDISVEKRDEQGNLVEQKLTVSETNLWTIDASQHIKARIKTINEKILEEKAKVINSFVAIEDKDNKDLDKQIKKLETEKNHLLDVASAKAIKYENRDAEIKKLYEINSKLRDLNTNLDRLFKEAIINNPLYSPLTFQVFGAEKEGLQNDLEYFDKRYFDDTNLAGSDKSGIDRFNARNRKAEFEAKYKSVDVTLNIQGINLKGGAYVRDMLYEKLIAFGFENPTLKGIENIQIGAVDSAFTASGKGVVNQPKKPGLSVRDIKIPFITAPKLAYKTDNMLLEAGAPMLENVMVSAAINFASNPLDKGVGDSYKLEIVDLKVEKASFNGLTLKMGKAQPLLDFPSSAPVEVWGLHMWNYAPETGNINLSINDVKARGAYSDTNEADKTSKKIEFGIDTTGGHKPGENEQPAIEINYDNKDKSVITKINIPSAWIPSLNIQSPALSVSSLSKDANAIELKNIKADVKILLEKVAEPGAEPGRPMSVEINNLHIGEINARGIKLVMRDDPDKQSKDPKAKNAKQTVQEVTLPKNDTVSIKDINVSGLRVTLAEEGTTLSTIEKDASLNIGKTDLSGIGYSEKTAKGSVLKAIALHGGKFDALSLNALGRNGREYSLKEFFKFFGTTRLEGLDLRGFYDDGKTSASLGITGQKNTPISIDYHEPDPQNNDPGYYDMSLPLSRINVPNLHIEIGDSTIIIPKPTDKTSISYMKDVDVTLRAYIDFDENNKVHYDIRLEHLDTAELNVFGLEYHNKTKGIDVVFEKLKPLKIPNVKAGGFHFSSSKGFDVFGKAGGWVTAGSAEQSITASFESIKARLTDGGFLAEKDGGRSALNLDIASLGFAQDKDGNMTITLGAIHGGFPKMSISQTDPKTKAVTKTVISSTDNKAVNASGVTIKLGADNNNVIDALGLTAGGIKVESVETKGTEKNTSTIKLASGALGADSASVKLNADSSKEITLTGIRGGQISADLVSEGKEKSVKNITLPDPDSIKVEAVIIKIDPDGQKTITLRKPTVRNFKLRMPDQTNYGDYISILCDLTVGGDVEMGDGNFASMKLAPPYDAFIVNVQDDVPVQIGNLHLEYKDSSASKAGPPAPPPALSPDQQELLRLEEVKDAALDKLSNTKPEIGSKKDPYPNPEYPKVKQAYDDAQKAYDAQKAKIISGAKAVAKGSMTKKYFDAVTGTAEAKLTVYNHEFTLNVETYNDEKYVQISNALVNDLKPVIGDAIASTVNAPFWKSKEIKELANELRHWYVTAVAPSASGYIEAIANGSGVGVVSLVVGDSSIYPGAIANDPSMFGINIKLNNVSWLAEKLDKDVYPVLTLCEKSYKHPVKDDYYNLYGIVEYLGYVNPQLVSTGGLQDAKKLKELLAGTQNVSDLGLKEAGLELLDFIVYSFGKELDNIKRSVLNNIQGVSVNADISLKPQEVLNELMKEKKAGTLTFDKGKKSIDDIHIKGDYKRDRMPQISGDIGGGKAGTDNIVIPGATYLSDDKGTKVSYSEIDIAPVSLTYNSDVYKIINKNIGVKGIKAAILKK
jgi:hypothetical protein